MIQKALPPGIVVFQEAPPRLADSEPEPDVAVVAGREADFKDRHPTTGCLVVEVAVSSAALDRANAALYAEAGIAEYWIVLGREQKVEIYRLGPEGAYGLPQLISNGEVLDCAAIPGVSLSISELFQ